MSFKRRTYPILKRREGQLNYSSQGGQANAAYLYPLYLRAPTPIVGIEAVARAAGNFQVGIYRWTSFGQATAEALYRSPILAATGVEVLEDPIEHWMTAGYTWLAFALDTVNTMGIATPRGLDGDYAKFCAASYPLPATITITGGGVFIPAICVVTAEN